MSQDRPSNVGKENKGLPSPMNPNAEEFVPKTFVALKAHNKAILTTVDTYSDC